MTVSPSGPSDGNGQPSRRDHRDPALGSTGLPPTLFRLPNLVPTSVSPKPVVTASPSRKTPLADPAGPLAVESDADQPHPSAGHHLPARTHAAASPAPTSHESTSRAPSAGPTEYSRLDTAHGPGMSTGSQAAASQDPDPGRGPEMRPSGRPEPHSRREAERSWPEKLAAHRNMLVLLSLVVGFAIWTSRRSFFGSVAPSTASTDLDDAFDFDMGQTELPSEFSIAANTDFPATETLGSSPSQNGGSVLPAGGRVGTPAADRGAEAFTASGYSPNSVEPAGLASPQDPARDETSGAGSSELLGPNGLAPALTQSGGDPQSGGGPQASLAMTASPGTPDFEALRDSYLASSDPATSLDGPAAAEIGLPASQTPGPSVDRSGDFDRVASLATGTQASTVSSRQQVPPPGGLGSQASGSGPDSPKPSSTPAPVVDWLKYLPPAVNR